MDRRLAAILAADVVGYSRLMGEDEAGTLTALKAHRAEFIDPMIAEHRGRIVKLMGDGVLIEFASVVDALQCAVAIQRGMGERNTEVPVDRRIAFRVGINLGDIIVDGDDIYGNGVNVAARLETLAEPGGICLSGRVVEQVEKNVGVGFASLGPQTVKNIEKPVNAYKVLLDPADAGKMVAAPKPHTTPRWRWGAVVAVLALIVGVGGAMTWIHLRAPDVQPASVDNMAFPLPDKPSIAVLPFDNLSGDPEQDHLADGITETVISTLSQIPQLFVIARNSVLPYKGKPVRVQDVAQDLGVRYVLEGSVQRSGDRLRTTVQLIDAIDGHHLWSESYDQDLNDLFALQDDVAFKTTVALQVELTVGHRARLRSGTTNDVKAWLNFVKADSEYQKYSREGIAKARELFTEAVRRDPQFADAWVGIGWTHWIGARFGYSADAAASLQLASDMADKAAAVNADIPHLRLLRGQIAFIHGDFDTAIAESQKAAELSPSDAILVSTLAGTMLYAGQFDKAIRLIEQAMRLDPRFPTWYSLVLGRSLVFKGEHHQAVAAAEQGLARAESPLMVAAHNATLAFAYADSGDLAMARQHGEQVIKNAPNLTISRYGKLYNFRNPADWQRFAEALRMAGLPE
jgi:adenylate cyclase